MSKPTRLDAYVDRQPGESAEDWFRRTFGPIPAPTAESAPEAPPDPTPARTARLRRAIDLLRRSLPPAYATCHLDAPELSGRVPVPAIGIGKIAYREDRVCLTGVARVGKTSLAVAMLRAWVEAHGRVALFIPAHRLGVARLLHPTGRGEAELVDRAIEAPNVLLDDLGSERDVPSNPIADVIFERHAHDRPLWVTTGLTREALVARYGAGVVARVFERARIIHVGPRTSKASR